MSEPEHQSIRCLFCEEEGEPITDRGQYGLPTHVRICPRCGLVFLSPRWTKERYQKFYEEEFGKYGGAGVEDREIGRKRAELVIDRVRSMTGKHRFDAILEVGAYHGFTLDAMKDAFHPTRLAAIEPSREHREKMAARGMEILGGDVDEDWGADGQFDLVVMRQVLEHMLDPIGALKKIRAALKPDGVLYVGVPNMMKPEKNTLDGYWFRVVHTYYFSDQTLRATAARAGLAFTHLDDTSMELFGVAVPCPVSAPVPEAYGRQRPVIRRAYVRDFFRNVRRSPLTTLLRAVGLA